MMMPSKQQGIALLTVLLVLGLAAFLARDMILVGRADSQRQIAIRDSLQAGYYVRGGEAYARALLRQDKLADLDAERTMDGKTEAWFHESLNFSLDDGEMLIRIEDLQGRFNLNNVLTADGKVDATVFAQLQRLLTRQGLSDAAAQGILDWIDPGLGQGAAGNEDSPLRAANPPRLSPNTLLVDVFELQGLDVLSREQFKQIEPFLTSLPSGTSINVNTARAEVLGALPAQGGSQGFSRLVARQRLKSWEQLGAALRENGVGNAVQLTPYLTTQSEYFQIEVVALYRDRSARWRSVIHRDPETGDISVMYRSRIGTLGAG